LSAGAPFNYAGLKHWLSNADLKTLEKIDFVLCLDDLVSSKNLYLHTSKQIKDSSLQKIFQNFASTASEMNIHLESVHKKIDLNSGEIDWPHEQFSFKRILAGTLSSHPVPQPKLTRDHIFTTKDTVNTTILERNTKFIAEALSKHLFNLPDSPSEKLEVFSGSLSLSEDFIESTFAAFSQVPRVLPFLNKKTPAHSLLNKLLSSYLSIVSNSSFSLDTNYVFYDGLKTSMNVYKVTPISFDLLLLASISIYLGILYVALKGPTESIKQIKKLFATKKGNRKK